MSEQYDAYLKEHINNVKRGYKWIKQNLSEEVADYDDYISENINRHDASKFEYEEYDAYDEHYYGEHKGEWWEVSNYNHAWLHHFHENPHHWEHWLVIDDPTDDRIFHAIQMPYQYVVEMICDWWAFSWKKGNLFEIFDWYKDNHNHIYLHEETRQQVEDLLAKMKEKLNSEFTQYVADMVDTADIIEKYADLGHSYNVPVELLQQYIDDSRVKLEEELHGYLD